ncbi:hypothetical protein FRX94_10060, partial [Corynebacterium canis]
MGIIDDVTSTAGVDTRMRCYDVIVVDDHDRAPGELDHDLPADQLVRHRIEVLVDLNADIALDGALEVLHVGIRLLGQGGHNRQLIFNEDLIPGSAIGMGEILVQRLDTLSKCLAQFGEGMKDFLL